MAYPLFCIVDITDPFTPIVVNADGEPITFPQRDIADIYVDVVLREKKCLVIQTR